MSRDKSAITIRENSTKMTKGDQKKKTKKNNNKNNNKRLYWSVNRKSL